MHVFIRRLFAATALLALGAGVPWAAAPSATDGSLKVGQMAPDFNLVGFDGKPMCLGDCLGDHPVMLVFWSYFCFPCQREMPQIEQIYREFGSDKLTVLGISLDGPVYDEKVLPYVREKGITFPNAYDRPTADFYEVAGRYGVVGTPTIFVLDSQGRTRFIQLGRLDPEILKGILKGVDDPSYCPEITPVSGPAKP